MKENMKKEMAIGIVLLFLSAGVTVVAKNEGELIGFGDFEENFIEYVANSNTDKNLISNKSGEISEETYKLGFGPAGLKSSEDCSLLYNISKEEAEHIYNEFFSNDNKNISASEVFKKNINILNDIGAISPELYEELTDYLEENMEILEASDQNEKSISQTDNYNPKIRFGPTLFFYASAMSQYTFIDDPSNQFILFGNMSRLSKIFGYFFNMDNKIFDFTHNITCAYYSKFTTWQIGIGGSVSIFASVGPLPYQNYYFYGPFLGVFIFPITLLGIYIYKEIETPFPGGSFEMPYLDIIIGMPIVFSLVLPGWYVNPDSFQ